MAYTTLFSLVPSLAVLFTLMGLFLPVLGDHSSLVDDAKQFLIKNLATGSGTQVIDYLESFLLGLDLKKIGMSMFVGLLVTLIILLHQIEQALNRIWLVSQARPMLTRFVYFWLFLTLGLFGLAVFFGISAKYSIAALITKKTLAVVDTADNIPIVAMAFNWLSGCVVFFLVYKIVPNCEVKNRAALRGAILAGTLFYSLSKFYTIYVSNVANYKSIYGTLAALPIFLMWIYVCWVVVLAGALFAWRVQAGFPSIEESKTIESATTHLEHLRNHSIQSRLPLVALLAIHSKFADGSGEGLSMAELVRKMKLPYSWVFDSVELLHELKLVVNGKVSGSISGEGERWFPANPAEKVSLASFAASIGKPLEEWLTSWDADLPGKVKAMMSIEVKDLKMKSVQDCI